MTLKIQLLTFKYCPFISEILSCTAILSYIFEILPLYLWNSLPLKCSTAALFLKFCLGYCCSFSKHCLIPLKFCCSCALFMKYCSIPLKYCCCIPEILYCHIPLKYLCSFSEILLSTSEILMLYLEVLLYSALFLLLNTVVYLYNSAALSIKNTFVLSLTYCSFWNVLSLNALCKYLILNPFTLKYCTSLSEILLLCHRISLFLYFLYYTNFNTQILPL